jgi:hypothetical protein
VWYLSEPRGDDLDDVAQEVHLPVPQRAPQDMRLGVRGRRRLATDWRGHHGRDRALRNSLDHLAAVSINDPDGALKQGRRRA